MKEKWIITQEIHLAERRWIQFSSKNLANEVVNVWRHKATLDPKILKLYSVKRFKAHLWKYESPQYGLDGELTHNIGLKDLAPVLKATRKFGVYDSSW